MYLKAYIWIFITFLLACKKLHVSILNLPNKEKNLAVMFRQKARQLFHWRLTWVNGLFERGGKNCVRARNRCKFSL